MLVLFHGCTSIDIASFLVIALISLRVAGYSVIDMIVTEDMRRAEALWKFK